MDTPSGITCGIRPSVFVRKGLPALAFVLSASLAFAAEKPLVMFRLALQSPGQESEINQMLDAIRANPGCCDNLWFATGDGINSLERHRQSADFLVRAAEKARGMGIVPSLQISSTIGHGDNFDAVEGRDAVQLPWQGWTGSNGIACRRCSCPRAPGFLKHLSEMARLYAAMKPAVVWIDDDLRVGNHSPAPDNPGCWCDECLTTFSAQEGRNWARADLLAAILGDDAVAQRWMAFSTEALAEVARTIAKAFRECSPKTQMALQFCMIGCDAENSRAILHEMHRSAGRPVAARTGAGWYYDLEPNGPLVKSYWAARTRSDINRALPGEVDTWCPEIECWPRVYGSRSARSILLEGFASLAHGMESLSMAVSGPLEPTSLYETAILSPLSKASPFLHAYARANAGTAPAGFTCPDAKFGDMTLHRFALAGIPLLPGDGRSFGEIVSTDRLDICLAPSAAIQSRRDALDARAGGTPSVLASPFIGLQFPHVAADGSLRTLGLVAARIEPQGPVVIRVRVAEGTRAVWWELGTEPIELPIVRTATAAQVTIPEIGAWNCGFIDFASAGM